jgi:ribosomal protein L37AE/L43A
MEFKCSECGGKLIEEGMTGIYFCENCKAMVYQNKETGNFLVIAGEKARNK